MAARDQLPVATTGKRFFKRSTLCFSLDGPEVAENRADFADRLERLAKHLVAKPGDITAMRWMLWALEGYHTTVGLARLLEIPTANLISLKRTGRTPPAIDDRMQELASALVERLRAPVAGAAEPLEYYADARLGDPWEGK